MKETFVSDTGPLISLEKIDGGYEFIKKMCKSIIIPNAVLKEVSEHYVDAIDYLIQNNVKNFIKVYKSPPIESISEIQHLDLGEQEAIALSLHLKLNLLIEEFEGRKVAERLNIEISGIAGLIIKGFHHKIISSSQAKRMLLQLKENQRINKILYEKLIEEL